MSRQLELIVKGKGEARPMDGGVEVNSAVRGTERSGTSDLMARVLERSNLQAALKKVKKNKGSPGIDGMTVEELPDYLRAHWAELREQLLSNRYRPSMIRQKLIPKSGGGERQLGIPTVLDRFIQQALLQVLQPIFDGEFSRHSYGFRPGRSAHQAVKAAREYIQDRHWITVDVDLSNFFDRVNHDMLMGKLSKRISDKLILGLIRRTWRPACWPMV